MCIYQPYIIIKCTLPSSWAKEIKLSVNICIHSTKEREEHEQHLWNARNHSLSNATYVMEHTQQLNAAISFMQALTTSLRVL